MSAHAAALVVAICSSPTTGASQDVAAPPAAPTIAIVPQPESLTVGRGQFRLTASTIIWTDAASADIARRFAASIAPATGFSLPVRVGTAATGIVLTRNPRLTRLGDEGYEVAVTARQVSIRARERAGVFYGLQTVRQLLPPEIVSRGTCR